MNQAVVPVQIPAATNTDPTTTMQNIQTTVDKITDKGKIDR